MLKWLSLEVCVSEQIQLAEQKLAGITGGNHKESTIGNRLFHSAVSKESVLIQVNRSIFLSSSRY